MALPRKVRLKLSRSFYSDAYNNMYASSSSDELVFVSHAKINYVISIIFNFLYYMVFQHIIDFKL